MSEATRIIQRAKEIRARLYYPPNALVDRGIDLKRKEEPKPQVEARVIVYQNGPTRLNFRLILTAVAEYYNIGIADLKGQSRKQNITVPRQVAMFLARKWLTVSTNQIGRDINRDHSTVINGCRKIESIIADEKIKVAIETIEGRWK